MSNPFDDQGHFKNRLGIFYVPPLTEELITRAKLVVCGASKDVKDASLIMDMLGLKENNE